MLHISKSQGITLSLGSTAAMAGLMAPVLTIYAAPTPDPTCVDYYTVGESNCRPTASTPVSKPTIQESVQNMQPVKVQSEVDKYLADYGKPPREFVEFYLNPTPENASKWVKSYQGMMQKGQDLSKAWSDAEQLYKATAGVTMAPALSEPMAQEAIEPALTQEVTIPSAEAIPAVERFGAFAGAQGATPSTRNGIQIKRVSLTYYFSQTCPYCARMTPQLAVIAKEMNDKLVFTCVDVTPVGPTSRPDEGYITAKLPCKWRTPATGEVEKQGVAQTPTLLIEKEGGAPVRLSGYVPMSQLLTYF